MNQLPRSAKWAAFGLLACAVLVWWRDTAWVVSAVDTLPLAAGIPLAIWLGAPWYSWPASHQPRWPSAWLALAVLALVVGWILPSVTLLSAAWTALAGYWIVRWRKPGVDLLGLLLVLLFSFPWLVMEWPQIGWWFRLSSAASTEGFFHLLQIPVLRRGTELLALGETIRIEPACAGWNLLQLTLLAGIVIGLHELRQRRRFFWFLAFLPILAWFANFLRIAALSALCLSFGVATAEGIWHGLTGMLVIASVIGMAKMLCLVIEPRGQVRIRHSHKP